MTCYIIQIGAHAKANDGDVEEQPFVFAVESAAEECPCLLRCHIHELHSRGDLVIVWRISQLWEGGRFHHVFVHDIA